VKSLTVFLPLPLLYLAGTGLFPEPWSLLVNAIGLLTAASIPYWIGRLGTRNIAAQYISPKAEGIIRNLEMDNSFLYTFVLRACHVAFDPVSMYLGNDRVSYGGFLLGTLAGTGPTMAAITIIGENIFSAGSPYFVPGIIMLAAIVLISFAYLYHVLRTKYPVQFAYLKQTFTDKLDQLHQKRK
jgi:uncharacterized membrane protein YdjX (TVP38/TMEM64 family)